MECTDVRPKILPYLHAELAPGEMRRIQLHLEGCGNCRRSLGEERTSGDLVIPFYMAAKAHNELQKGELATFESHLVWCEPCRAEYAELEGVSNELIKTLSQYQLTRAFRQRVMREWKPHRIGRRTKFSRHGLADMIERAEAGNTFSYERHVDHFKDYAYGAAFLKTGDFHRANEITRRIFVEGMPVFDPGLTHGEFLEWLDKRAEEMAKGEGWLEDESIVADEDMGLSGYTGSRKLRRHRLIIAVYDKLAEAERMPFLLHYVQRLSYAEIASLLEIDHAEIFATLSATTGKAVGLLREDDKLHPTKKRNWER